MARPKKEEVSPDVETVETVETPETQFPYKLKLKSTGEVLTVVSEGTDALGRKTLITDAGCTYHAESAE